MATARVGPSTEVIAFGNRVIGLEKLTEARDAVKEASVALYRNRDVSSADKDAHTHAVFVLLAIDDALEVTHETVKAKEDEQL